MSYYFKNDKTKPGDKIKLPTVDYPAKKAAFLAKLGEGITNRKRAAELRKMLDETISAARDVMKDADGEALLLVRAYQAELDKTLKENDKRYGEALEQAQAVQRETFVDPSLTPELDAKVNALALSYVGELAGMHGQENRKDELFKRALASREGAMALLRLPTTMLSSRIQTQAAKLAKSPAETVFDTDRKARLDQLNAKCADIYSEGFQYRTIAKSLFVREAALVRAVAASEAKAI